MSSVGDLCRVAFDAVGLDFNAHVRVDDAFRRPGQPTRLLANPERAARVLGWRAQVPFATLIQSMVEADRIECTRSNDA